MAKATSWFAYVNTILATIGGEHGKINDRKTYGVLSKVIPGLMTKRGIDGDLKAAFLTNIHIRANVPAFDHAGPIILTHAQRTNARANKWDQLEAFDTLYSRQAGGNATEMRNECGMDVETEEAILHWFRTYSALNPQSFRTHSALLPQNLLDKLAFWCSSNGMEWNVNHEPSMISAEPIHEEPITPPLVIEDFHDGTEPVPIHQESEAEEVIQRNTRDPRKPDTLSIWVKERRGTVAASGNLEIGGDKFSLKFQRFYSALESVPRTSSNPEWLRVMEGMIADAVLPVERELHGVAGRSTMSALHSAEDCFGYKEPVADRSVVVLAWEDDKPVSATIIDGDDRLTVELKQHNGTLFKGRIKLPVGEAA